MELETQVKRILIIKPSSLGDVVHALPVLKPLREAFAGARISWLIRPEFAGLLECVAGVDEIVLFDRRRMGNWWYSPAGFQELRRFVGTLRGSEYDLVLDLQGLFRSGVFAWLTGCPRRLGVSDAREGAGWFYTRQPEPLKPGSNIFEYYRQVLAAAGVTMEQAQIEMQIGPEAQARASALLAEHGLAEGRYAVLVPGSAHAAKCWPADRFAQVAEFLAREKGLAVAAVGTKGESEAIEHIRTRCAEPLANLAGRTDLAALLEVFRRGALTVGNDTGPTHMAAMLDQPTVIVYGPSNPGRVSPWGKPETVAAVEPWTRGRLIKNPHPKYRIENVSAAMVIERIEAQFK